LATNWNERFFETTRGQLVTLLRRSGRTAEELAHSQGLTYNGVRVHLAVVRYVVAAAVASLPTSMS
jgi:hypothetical protein